MNQNWNKSTLGNLLTLIIDYRGKTPKKLGGEWQENGIPAISAKNIKKGTIVRKDTIKYVSDNLYNKWMKDKLRPHDIILTSEAPLGELLYLKKDCHFLLSQRLYALRCNKNKIVSKYLYYYLESRIGQNELHSRGTGSTVKGIRQTLLKEVNVTYPENLIQQKIASVLSAYDDLIKKNTRKIEILEEMIQRVYKEWFINQDIEERSILEIPYFTFLKQNIKKFDGLKRYYATADVEGTNFVKDGINYDYKSKPSRAQKKPILNSIWFARMKDSYKIAIFTKVNALQAENSILSSGFAGFSSKDMHFGFLYSTISSNFFDRLKNLYGTGATQISLNNNGLSKIYVPYPNEEKVLEFSNIVNPIIDKSILIKNINKNLIETRDYLLPKLISGKVDVSDLDIDTSILDD